MLARFSESRGTISFLGSLALALVILAATPAMAAADAYLTGDVRSVSTNANATGFNLGTVMPTDGLYLIPYYLRLHFPARNYTAWGVQLYTANTRTAAFTARDGSYGGLRGLTDVQEKLPLYWQVYDSLQDAAGNWGTPQSVTTMAGGLAFYDDALNGHTLRYWGLVKDLMDYSSLDEAYKLESILERSLVGYREGLGRYPAAGRNSTLPPVFLYLGIDVSGVRQTQQFGTTLHIDLYNLGIPITSGGYATPNPFTPTTGQKASFNFFLQDINSSFQIKIFTVRGRCIRTITAEREWDGRNDSGQIVEGGLYIYQIEAEGKRVSGTVVLIK